MFETFKHFYAVSKTFIYFTKKKVCNVFLFLLVLQFSFLIQYIPCHAIVYDIIIFRYPISLQWKTANDVQINWYTFFPDLKNNPRIWPIVLNEELTLLHTRLHWLILCTISGNQYLDTRYAVYESLFEFWICTIIMVTIIFYILELYSTLAHCCNTLDVSQMHV